MSDQNLEIKIDLKLDDEKAQSQMQQALKTLKEFTNNKANNINIKVNVDDTSLKGLSKIESAIKEINKLSKDTQKSLFGMSGSVGGVKTDNTAINSIKEQQKLYEQRRKQEIMYSQMFDKMEKQKIKEQERMYKDLFDTTIRQEKEVSEAKKQERKNQENMYKDMFDSIAKQQKEATEVEKRELKERENIYKSLFDTAIEQEKAITKAKAQERKDQEDMYKDMFKTLEKQEKEATAIKQKELKEQESMYKSMFDSIAQQEKKTQKDRAKSYESINKDILKAQSKIGKLEKSGFVDTDELEKVKASLREISDIHVWDNIDNLDLTNSRSEIDKILESLKQIDDVRLENLKDAKVDNFTTKLTSDLDKLEDKFKEIGKSTEGIDRLRAELQTLDSVAPDKLPTTFQRMRQEVAQLNDELRQSTKEASGMGTFLGDISDSMRTFTLGNMIGDGIVSSIRSVTQSFKEMDDAITNVKKVAEATDVNSALKLDNIKSQAIDIAKEVGMASTDVINGIADSLQAGMGSMEQSIAVARSSLMLANVGDMTQNQASSALNTMIKGFKIDPLKEVNKEMDGVVVKTNELTEAMDMLNHAGNNYAIGTDGVAEALKRGGSVLSEYGVSLGDTVALITSANEAVQNPEKVGNGMKSIAINLAGMKANASEGTLELNKTAKTLKEIAGIKVYSNEKTGEVKNMVQIIDEVQQKWKSLRDDEKLTLSEAIAGKEQAMIFQSLMGNFNTFKKMREEFANNDHLGSAERENAQYVDSIAGKLNHLKEVWVSISQTMVSSDFTKGLLDGAIKVSEAIDTVVKALDEMNALTPTLLALGGTFGSIMKTMIGNGKNGASLFMPRAKEGIFSTLKKDISSSTDAVQTFKNVSSTATTAVYSGVKDLSKGFVNAGKFIGSFVGQGLMIAGVTLAVQALAKAWDKMANGLENAEKEIKNTIDELNESVSSNKSSLKYLEDTETRYNELIAKKKEYSKIPVENLSDEQLAEMQELKDITVELAEMFPQLVIGYDSEGSPIMLMANDMEKLKEKTREQIELDQKLLKIEREKLAVNSRKQIQEMGLTSNGIATDIDRKDSLYEKTYDDMLASQQRYLKGLAEGDKKYADGAFKSMSEGKAKLQEIYNERLQLYQDYSQKEIEIQQSAFDQIQAMKGYDKLDETQLSSLQTFIDNLNWGSLDETQYNTWINGSRELIEMAQEGNPKLEEWNKTLEKANDVYSATGNVEEYKNSLKGIAKAISDDLNIPYETVFAGLENMVEPLAPAEKALQDFLQTFGKTRYELLNGDSIAQSLAEQFEGVSNVINNILANGNSFNDAGILKIPMMIQIANTDSLPDQVQKLANDFTKDNKISAEESQIIIDLMYVLQEGDTDEAKAKIKEINDELAKMNKEPISIEALFDIKGAEQVGDLNKALDELQKSRSTAEVEILVNGVDKAELYLDIINKLRADPTTTNKFIIENQEALSQMESYEEVVKWLQQNPDIVSKYKIEGIEAYDEGLKKKKELEKDGEGKTVVKYTTEGGKEVTEFNATVKEAEGEKKVSLKIDNGQVLDYIDDVETLIKYSSEMENGQYKLDIQANTADAVTQLGKLEEALKKIRDILKDTPTTTFKIETAQASKNVTGLRNNIEKLQKPMSTNTALVFNSETAQASKNITGLIKNAEKCMALKPKPIVFKSETAQASKNITGLINKINSVPTGTKTITYKVNTEYIKKGAEPQAVASGVSVVNDTRRVLVDTEFVNARTSQPQPVAEPMVDTPVTYSPTVKAKIEPRKISNSMANEAFKLNVDIFKDMEKAIKDISNELSILDKKVDSAFGKEKQALLERQVKLYKEQQQLQHKLAEDMRVQQNEIKYYLSQQGVKFGKEGEILNYKQKILEVERQIEKLNSASSNSSDKNASSKNDAQLKSLELTKRALEEYMSLTTDKIPSASQAWWDLHYSIQEVENDLNRVKVSMKTLDAQILVGKFESALNKVRREINRLDEDIDRAFGKKKEELLNKKIDLIKKEQEELHKLANAYRQQANVYKDVLSGSGFRFDSSGMITNYEHIKNLMDDSNFESIKEALESYIDLTQDKIPNLSEEWWDLQDSIEDVQQAIEDAQKELQKFLNEAKVEALRDDFNDLNHEIAMLDKLLENAFDSDKVDLLSKKIELLKKQQIELQKQHEFFEDKKDNLQSELGNLGFTFDDNGDISNYVSQLEKLGNSADNFDEIKEKLAEYLKLQNEELPSIAEDWLDLENAIKNAYKEQLNITASIEKQITDIYKKQAEERKKLIDDELKKRLDAINKEKDAYNKAREEAKYQDNYNDQMEKVKNLEKQLEIAKKDTSLAGQKKVQDLLNQLKDEQKKLQDMVQDKIDDQINDMFDQENDRLQEEADKAKEDLDEQFSDKKIQELVKEALNTGVFEDIDGTMRSLQDVMLEFVDEYGDGLGATGDLIKSELIANLEVAKKTMKDMVDISKELGLIEPSYGGDVLNGASRAIPQGRSAVTQAPIINFNESLINIEGNVDRNIVDELKALSQEIEDRVIDGIVRELR